MLHEGVFGPFLINSCSFRWPAAPFFGLRSPAEGRISTCTTPHFYYINIVKVHHRDEIDQLRWSDPASSRALSWILLWS